MHTNTNTVRKRGRLFFVLVFFSLLAIPLTFTTPLSRTKKTLKMSDERRFSPALKDEFDFEFLDEEEGDLDYWDQDETNNNDIDDDDSNTYYKKRMGKFRYAFIDAFDDETFEAKEEEEEVSDLDIDLSKLKRDIVVENDKRKTKIEDIWGSVTSSEANGPQENFSRPESRDPDGQELLDKTIRDCSSSRMRDIDGE